MTDTPQLNEGQAKAEEGFFGFLFSEDKEAIISGPGGVGKTYLMSQLIDRTLPRYFETCKLMGIQPIYGDVRMTATTNKAAEVLAQATKRPTETIHTFMNLTVKDDYQTGESKLSKTRNWMVHHNKILFIDESSMIDKSLMDTVLEGTHNSKIVYVGDHCQLSPIKEPISPIYRKNLPFWELTEPMRTDNPDLLAVQQQLRQTVETGEFHPIKIIPGVIDWLNDADMQYALQHVFNQQTHDSRILAYTNNQVMLYNDHIREIRQLPPVYTPGEFLVSNSAVKLSARMISVEEEVTVLRASDQIEDIWIDDEVFLKVQRMDLESSIGEIFTHVPVPVDRAHYSALLKYYAKAKIWHTYFRLKNDFPDLRQRDAATVHKSQGSTYDSVFIDLGDISTCRNPNQAARLLYVAFTRPRSRIFLYGNLAERFGGLIE
jgi:hypothetical protein